MSSKERKLTREQLLQSLEILGPLTVPLSPYLPPSPPVSRDNSPNPLKRRLDTDSDESQRKKPRVNSSAKPSNSDPSASHPTPSTSRSSRQHEPSEDGEVREETSNPITAIPHYVPVRRPRRGNRLPYDDIYVKYHSLGRTLKYSGETRLWSTYPPTYPDYQPLVTPIPVTSPYHKYGSLLARIELVDALINFVYAIWAKDYSRPGYIRAWSTVDGYLNFTKDKWIKEDCDEREKVFLGLIYMIEGFIRGRESTHGSKQIDEGNEWIMKRLKIQAAAEVAREAAAAEAARAAVTASQLTPPMLPSPVSVTSGSSSNSTPTTKQEPTSAPSSATSAKSQGKPTRQEDPLPPKHITVPVHSHFIQDRKTQSNGVHGAVVAFDHAQRFLTLPILAKHYPRTFARTVYTSLTATDEHEPDFDDDECELFWPGQALAGRGLGWVCLMGKSLINEFSKPYGYRGIDGVILKLDGDSGVGDGTIPASTPPSQRKRMAAAADPSAPR
ncbi:hypothetical protein BKA93DRAFT_747191 [Sparassis latifolia]